jgi:hypothetical protein
MITAQGPDDVEFLIAADAQTGENATRIGSKGSLGETVTARMTGMGPVDAEGNTTAAFEWSLVESTPGIRGGRFYFDTPVPVLQSRVTDQAGVYAVEVRLPESLRGGDYRYEGMRVKLAGGQPVPLSPMPLRTD